MEEGLVVNQPALLLSTVAKHWDTTKLAKASDWYSRIVLFVLIVSVSKRIDGICNPSPSGHGLTMRDDAHSGRKNHIILLLLSGAI